MEFFGNLIKNHLGGFIVSVLLVGLCGAIGIISADNSSVRKQLREASETAEAARKANVDLNKTIDELMREKALESKIRAGVASEAAASIKTSVAIDTKVATKIMEINARYASAVKTGASNPTEARRLTEISLAHITGLWELYCSQASPDDCKP